MARNQSQARVVPRSAGAGPLGQEWLTQMAFVLALALLLARGTMGDFSRARGEPMGSEAPRAAGAATGLALDLLCCLPAILVLARRVSDREYVLRWYWSVLPLALLAGWGALSAGWAADKFAALLAGFHLLAALAMLWAGSQLVRSWLRLRIVAAVALGLLLAYFTHALFYRLVDLPDLKANWEKNKAQIVAERGLADDPFMAQQLENRVLSGELMGFFLSSNSMAAVVVLLLVISIGVAVQRMKDDPSDRAGIALLLAVPMAGWMIFYTQSRTAYVTPVLGLALLAAAWRGRRWLAQRSRHAFWMGMGVVGLGAMAVIGHGLYHKSLVHPSLTFRWNYWVGGMRIFLQHPLAGIGLDNFGYHYLAARLPEASEEVKDPHNFLVKFLTELGVLGGMLCVAWLGRLAWEVTRPIVPPTGKAPLPRYRGARAINTIAIIAGLGLLINIVASLDFTADKGYVIFEVLRKLSMFALLLIGASVAAIKSLQAPELDARPAPFLLYAMLMALGIFLVHNLIDFSLFEPGAMMTFAFIAGSALGVRTPSVAGQKKRTAAAAVSLGICIVLWLVAGGFVWAPTAVAEDAANDAGIAMRNNRPDKALRLLEQAREHQPLNADYAFRAAQSIISSNPAYSPLVPDLLEKAIRRNPLAVEYYLTRARYLLRNSSEQRDQIIKDFMRVMELNPNEVSLRVEFADALASFNTAEDRARAVEQYREAQRYNAMLKPNEPKRLKPDKVSEIEKRIAELKK